MKTPKSIVSKKKRRFVDKDGGFDLDLSYIGGGGVAASGKKSAEIEQGSGARIIAMGFPSEGVSKLWRNPLDEVRRFLDTFHLGKYAIFNLCSETEFHQSLKRFDQCRSFGFDDRNPCPLAMIRPFCLSVDEWLGRDPDHVVAVHCRAGKGRTGMMVSCYLLHCGECPTAEEALRTFGTDRTKNGKGVTIPSQMRYVEYYQRILGGFEVRPRAFRIESVRLVGVPDFASTVTGGGCDPFLRIMEYWLDEPTMTVKKRVKYDQRRHVKEVRHYAKSDEVISLDCSGHDIVVRGDVKLIVYHQEISWPKSTKKEMCHVWFHTGFVERGHLSFGKTDTDWACKDKKSKVFDPAFRIEITLQELRGPTDCIANEK